MNVWAAPTLKMSLLGSYVLNSTSWQSSWDESEIGGDWDPSIYSNYASTYKTIHDSMVGKFGATEAQIVAFSTFAGCFFYQGGYDISRETFLTCHHNQESQDAFTALLNTYYYGEDYKGSYGDTGYGYGADSGTAGDDAANTNDKFVSDLMAFWDTYLVYNDDDFAEYLYEFPKYVAE
jgi:hypothetical protein